MQATVATRPAFSGWTFPLMLGLVGLTLGTFGVEATHDGPTEYIALVFAALPLVLAVLIGFGKSWAVTAAVVVAAIYMFGAPQAPGELAILQGHAATRAFAAIALELLSAVVVVIAGIGAIVQSRRVRA